ncbi:hypothetical protein [Falsochrobactrum shanghaiense]|uniref:hypothetical protein n=1 Tax=Falsochrobactrum shanghaiense TaxID=2201899 RepID=UPI0018EE5254|nr:hypothetical protein [Falsochrobactrum shanghaiense]
MHKRRFGSDDRGKREDFAALIPVFGAILLMPLLANLFLTRTRLFGLPLDMLYLFAVWGLLICGAIGLSYWLPNIGASGEEDEHGKNRLPQSGNE